MKVSRSNCHQEFLSVYKARSLVQWLGQKAHIQEVVGSNPAVYWIDVSNISYYIFNKKGNKGGQMGLTKKKYLKKLLSVYFPIKNCQKINNLNSVNFISVFNCLNYFFAQNICVNASAQIKHNLYIFLLLFLFLSELVISDISLLL